jgi:DNA-binding NarL/FixJ family response regulator
MQLVREARWDVVILDLSLPDRSGLQLLGELKREQPELPVVVLTMHGDDEYAVRAVRGGASAYVTKESAPEELITAVRKVMAGGRYMTPALAEKVAFGYASQGGPEKPHQTLSERELQILRLIGVGKSLKEIAATLELSVKSVGTYRTRLLEKMSMSTNADLIRYVIENQLSV